MNLLFLLSTLAYGQDGPRRLALVVGTNDGGDGRVALQYAETDARAVADVLHDLGGVSTEDIVLLLGPDKAALQQGFASLQSRIDAANARTEVIVYYSGHSDESGLLLGEQALTYRDLRAEIDALSADVRVAVLDSCASGALVRGKGGVHMPAFLLDESVDVRGTAILTSSAADEAAQEADRIQASFFTHYLISGLRGAADVTGDGRVTLNEAYRFAFDETLQRTETTGRGAQHASYDIELSGTGDLVMTDLGEANAVLIVPTNVHGRVFVRDAAGKLAAEVYSPGGRLVELGLATGRYDVLVDQGDQLLQGEIVLGEGARVTLDFDALASADRDATTARGTAELRHVVARAMFFPPLDRGAPSPLTLANVSFNVLAGSGHTVHGVEIGGLGNRLHGDHHGFEFGGLGNWIEGEAFGLTVAGIGNVIGGKARGAQMGGLINTFARNAGGWQVAGVGNVMREDAIGWQVAGVGNVIAGEAVGWQVAGVSNTIAGDARGWTVAGAANVVGGNAGGWQLAGGATLTRGSFKGMQTSVVNSARNVTGAQIGLVNFAGHVQGTQIGLVNVAKTMKGAPIGLVNVIGDGRHNVAVWTSDTTQANLGVKLGSKSVYTLLGVGAGATDGGYSALQVGIGGHVPVGPAWVELDGSVLNTQRGNWFTATDESLVTMARLGVGYDVVKSFAPFAGISANLEVDLGNPRGGSLSPVPATTWGTTSVWPGFFAGVQY